MSKKPFIQTLISYRLCFSPILRLRSVQASRIKSVYSLHSYLLIGARGILNVFDFRLISFFDFINIIEKLHSI